MLYWLHLWLMRFYRFLAPFSQFSRKFPGRCEEKSKSGWKSGRFRDYSGRFGKLFKSLENRLGASPRGFESLHFRQKIRQVTTCRIFLSKPQAWHIITVRSAVYIISPFGAVSHHALACIFPAAWWYTTLRVGDIQCFALMIYTPLAWLGCDSSNPNKKGKNIFFIQVAGLVYHWRTVCGVYH